MIASWTVILSALVYLCFLFVVAQYGDRGGSSWLSGRPRATIYALGLSVYCTSWTIYGSVDFAAINGIAFCRRNLASGVCSWNTCRCHTVAVWHVAK